MSALTPASLSRDAQRLLSLADAYIQSGSQLEDKYWDARLDQQFDKILAGRKNRHIEQALEFLGQHHPPAYDALVEKAEALTESLSLDYEGTPYDALLVSAPIVTWTRYQLPDGKLSKARQQALLQALQDTILVPGAQVAIATSLLNFESMPQSFHETRALTRQLAQSVLSGQPFLRYPKGASQPAGNMLADVRYLTGVVLVPRGEALFQWQQATDDAAQAREQCAQAWKQACTPIIESLFTGCHTECLRPDAYYTNSREAELRLRPLMLRAAVSWLQSAASLAPSELRAAIVGCGEPMLQEYRVGFSTLQDKTVIYGCQWPLLNREEAMTELMDSDQPSAIEEITAILREEGISEIRRLPDSPLGEFCDDCGAPFFPDMLGELQHPELPEEANLDPLLFH